MTEENSTGIENTTAEPNTFKYYCIDCQKHFISEKEITGNTPKICFSCSVKRLKNIIGKIDR